MPAEANVIDIAEAVPLPKTIPQDLETLKSTTRKVDANDLAARLGQDGYFKWICREIESAPVVYRSRSRIVSLRDLRAQHPEMRPFVIDGLLRRGEIMNIIAAPKYGKSWLGIDLTMAIIQGGKWFNRFQTSAGRVLIIDNELHEETISFRADLVTKAKHVGVSMDYVDDRIDYISLRGKLVDLDGLAQEIQYIRPGEYRLIILDAFYRFLPPKCDENDNGQIANLYNKLDMYASQADAAICLIHHTSKGGQAGKQVTDVGAGAGVQSRATDTHLVLRPHKDTTAVSIQAAVRSFKSPDPFCARFKFPIWETADDLDPNELLGAEERHAGAQAREQRGGEKERLLAVITKPVPIAEMVAMATRMGLQLNYNAINTAIRQDWLPNKRLRIVNHPTSKTKLYINSSVKTEDVQSQVMTRDTEQKQAETENIDTSFEAADQSE